MFGLHERPLTYDVSSLGTIKPKNKKGKDLTNQTVKPRWAWPKTGHEAQPSHLQISLSRDRHTSSRGGGSNSFFFTINNTTCGFQGVSGPHAPIWIRTCPRLRLYWSGSKLFDTLTVFSKIVLKFCLKIRRKRACEIIQHSNRYTLFFPLYGKLDQHM